MARTTLPLTEPLHRYRARGHGRARPVHPNTATAVLMSPLALADELQACLLSLRDDLRARCVVRLHDPLSSRVNTPVVGPGDYTFFDFVRVGVPFS